MKKRIVAAYIISAEALRIQLSLNSILNFVDKVYIIWSPRDIETVKEIQKLNSTKIEIILEPLFDPNDKGLNGKVRNEYLKILKEKEIGSWCLVLDGDEIVDETTIYDIQSTLDQLEAQQFYCVSPRIRHLIRTLGWEDATREKHYVPCRLFKVKQDLWYPEEEHNVLRGYDIVYELDTIVIWHMSSMYDIFYEYKKYLNNKVKSIVHTEQYLETWKRDQILGTYPVKKVYKSELPEVLIDYFKL